MQIRALSSNRAGRNTPHSRGSAPRRRREKIKLARRRRRCHARSKMHQLLLRTLTWVPLAVFMFLAAPLLQAAGPGLTIV